MHRLILEQQQKQNRIEQRRDSRDALLPLTLRLPQEIGSAKDQPIEHQDPRASSKLRKRMPMATHGLDDRPQPKVVIQITRQDAKDFHPEPLHTANDHPQTGSQQRAEEHTSELQSRLHLVCRLLLEKKKNK